MVNAIGSTDLNAYVAYLKEQNQQATSSSLDFKLEDYLNDQDAESVIKISDETLSDAGEDVVRANADKLSVFGVTADKIDNVFGSANKSQNSTSSDSASNTGNSISALKERSSIEKQNNTKSVNKTSAINTKNNASRAALQAQIDTATVKHQTLNEEYNALKSASSQEQEIKTQSGNEQKNEYEKNTVGKVDQAEAMKSAKYQEIESNQDDNSKQNVSTEGFKVASDNSFKNLSTSINSSSSAYDNSTGYNLAGVNLFETGSEVISTGENINDQAISIVEAGLAQMSATSSIVDPNAKQSALSEAQSVYDRGIALVNDSFDTMSLGRGNNDDSLKYYTESDKYVNSGNIFMSKSSMSLNDINNSNADLSAKILELQSQKTSE